MTAASEERDRLIADIEVVFDGISRADGITLHEAKAIDRYASVDELERARAKDCESRWQDVPDEAIEGGGDSLTHFDAEGLRYYLPAYMRWILRSGTQSESNSSRYTIYTLTPSIELRDYFEERIALFSHVECGVICRFLRFVLEHGNGEFRYNFDVSAAREALRSHWGVFCPEKDGDNESHRTE